MELYIYKIGMRTPALTIKNVTSYTADKAITEEGCIYGPFAEDYELSSKLDCSETLREDWRRIHPLSEQRINELEALMAEVLFGGATI